MKGTMLIYRHDGDTEPEVRELDRPPNFRELQAVVGGTISGVPWREFEYQGKKRHCVVFCHDEGKLIGLPLNVPATQLWHKNLPSPGLVEGEHLIDYLVGNIVILIGDEAFMREV